MKHWTKSPLEKDSGVWDVSSHIDSLSYINLKSQINSFANKNYKRIYETLFLYHRNSPF